jgi:hypothetical protein
MAVPTDRSSVLFLLIPDWLVAPRGTSQTTDNRQPTTA